MLYTTETASTSPAAATALAAAKAGFKGISTAAPTTYTLAGIKTLVTGAADYSATYVKKVVVKDNVAADAATTITATFSDGTTEDLTFAAGTHLAFSKGDDVMA